MVEPQQHSVLSDEATLHDNLGRENFVNTLKELLLKAETPLVVALYGAWGSGKTSMMKQLQSKLEESNSSSTRSIRTAWFNPWEHSGDDQPGLSLLLAIRRDLKLQDVRVQRALTAIALAVMDDIRVPYIGLSLGRVRTNYRQLAEQDVERRSEQALLREHYSKVIRIACGIDDDRKDYEAGGQKRLIVFIDDLDRCQPTTAVTMLEALKLYFNERGCIFVLGIDREPIEAAIAHEYEDLGIAKESYLDKIVQLPFVIPALRQGPVEDYVKTLLSEELGACKELLILGAPDNPRQLKRTINTLFLLDNIAEISFPGRDTRILCALALIQNSAPDLYQHLRQNPADWVLVVPPVTDSQEPYVRPAWLKAMLSGTNARQTLSNALDELAGMLARASIGIVEFRPYIELGEQVTSRTPASEHPEPRGLRDQQATGRTDEAISLYERALDERKSQHGDDDPESIATQNDLANAYQSAGRIDEAIALYQETLPKMVRVLGADHPNTLAAQSSLAGALLSAGRTDEAIGLYRQTLDGMMRVLGADHPNTLAAQSSLAGALQLAGRTDEAIRLYRQTLDGMMRVLGPDHRETQAVRSRLDSLMREKSHSPSQHPAT